MNPNATFLPQTEWREFQFGGEKKAQVLRGEILQRQTHPKQRRDKENQPS